MESEALLAKFDQLQSSDNGFIIWLFVVVLAISIASLALRWSLAKLEQKSKVTKNIWDDAFLGAARAPASLLIWVLGLSWIGEVMQRKTESAIFALVDPAREVMVIFCLTWFVFRFLKLAEEGLINAREPDSGMDKETLHAIGRLIRTAVIVTAVLVALQTLGYNISGILAFGSIGGLAVSFAAKDLLANFFGGLMVYLDRPFSVGDWIRSPDKSLEGTVEQIGWRTTRIRTFDQRPLYVPNSVFTNIVVENPSRMRNRRIYETIGVRYNDFTNLQGIVDDVKAMLSEHPEIDTSRTLMVNFNEYSAYSLDFFVYTFTKTTDWVEFHKIKQQILIKIGEIIEGHGAEIAFPTTTVQVEGNAVQTAVAPS